MGVGVAHKENRQVAGVLGCVSRGSGGEKEGQGGKETGHFINHQLPFKNGV